MSKTKQLADRLGIVRRRKIESKSSGISSDDSEGKLKYLLVIDFESTCWKEKAASPPPEVIEFPVVVLCLSTGKVVAEFQQYVMPLENPRLSPFCTELTGIQQQQVDNGVPISTCLVLFSQWLREVSEKENFDVGLEATCLTWSDWDLKVCLDNECRRKQIRKPQVLCSWVDIRAVYREFYKRRPQGLNGALRELGLSFEGREHSGIEDARNTARLVWRMIQDGWKPLPDKPQDGWRAHLDKPQDGWRAHLDKPQLSTNRVVKPSTSGISRPSTSNVLKPSNCGISKPSGSGISRPSSSGISKPTSSNISRPSKAAISIPRSSGKSVPSNTEISKASSTETSKASSTATSKPSSTATSKPSSAATSKPSTSTATAKCPKSRVANPSTVILSEKLSSVRIGSPSRENSGNLGSILLMQEIQKLGANFGVNMSGPQLKQLGSNMGVDQNGLGGLQTYIAGLQNLVAKQQNNMAAQQQNMAAQSNYAANQQNMVGGGQNFMDGSTSAAAPFQNNMRSGGMEKNVGGMHANVNAGPGGMHANGSLRNEMGRAGFEGDRGDRWPNMGQQNKSDRPRENTTSRQGSLLDAPYMDRIGGRASNDEVIFGERIPNDRMRSETKFGPGFSQSSQMPGSDLRGEQRFSSSDLRGGARFSSASDLRGEARFSSNSITPDIGTRRGEARLGSEFSSRNSPRNSESSLRFGSSFLEGGSRSGPDMRSGSDYGAAPARNWPNANSAQGLSGVSSNYKSDRSRQSGLDEQQKGRNWKEFASEPSSSRINNPSGYQNDQKGPHRRY